MNHSYGFFDVLTQINSVNIAIGVWDYTNYAAMQYLNLKNPFKPDDNGNDNYYLKYIAKLIWKDTVFNDSGKITNGTLRDEFENYETENLKALIDSISSYVLNFLKIDNEGKIYYPDKNTVESINLECANVLNENEYLDFFSVFLSADLTNGYWAPITYTITLEGEGDISD
jgi:hypothetical protein